MSYICNLYKPRPHMTIPILLTNPFLRKVAMFKPSKVDVPRGLPGDDKHEYFLRVLLIVSTCMEVVSLIFRKYELTSAAQFRFFPRVCCARLSCSEHFSAATLEGSELHQKGQISCNMFSRLIYCTYPYYTLQYLSFFI